MSYPTIRDQGISELPYPTISTIVVRAETRAGRPVILVLEEKIGKETEGFVRDRI